MHYNKDFGIDCRIARFHNIHGPYGILKGGREKAAAHLAAFCRKVSFSLVLNTLVREPERDWTYASVKRNVPHNNGVVCQRISLRGGSSGQIFMVCHNSRLNRYAFHITAQVQTFTKDIEMWGNGLQRRSLTFIDHCVPRLLMSPKWMHFLKSLRHIHGILSLHSCVSSLSCLCVPPCIPSPLLPSLSYLLAICAISRVI